MTISRKTFRMCCTTIIISFALTSWAKADPFDAAVPVEKPVEKLQFDTITPFLKFSDAWGDRAKGAHGTFGMIPAMTASPSHIHSAAYHGAVIKGVMTDAFNGEKDPERLPAGSYWYVPANAVHITACVSAEPCLFYTHSDGKFDFAPAEPRK